MPGKLPCPPTNVKPMSSWSALGRSSVRASASNQRQINAQVHGRPIHKCKMVSSVSKMWKYCVGSSSVVLLRPSKFTRWARHEHDQGFWYHQGSQNLAGAGTTFFFEQQGWTSPGLGFLSEGAISRVWNKRLPTSFLFTCHLKLLAE